MKAAPRVVVCDIDRYFITFLRRARQAEQPHLVSEFVFAPCSNSYLSQVAQLQFEQESQCPVWGLHAGV